MTALSDLLRNNHEGWRFLRATWPGGVWTVLAFPPDAPTIDPWFSYESCSVVEITFDEYALEEKELEPLGPVSDEARRLIKQMWEEA